MMKCNVFMIRKTGITDQDLKTNFESTLKKSIFVGYILQNKKFNTEIKSK